MEYGKLKKKQLLVILDNTQLELNELTNKINNLEIELQAEKDKPEQVIKEPEYVVEMTTIDTEIINFYEERINNTIYKEMIDMYKKDLDRIKQKYM